MIASATASIPGQHWQWRDQNIYYVHAGNNQKHPPLLLVHGFGASTDHWRKNITELSRDFDIWAIDLLGFGRSAKPDWQYSGDLWREQLHDFIQEAIGRPAVLVGNSLGGYACLCVAAEYSKLVAGVVLLNSAGPFTNTNPLGSRQISPAQKIIGKLGQSVLKQPWASFLLFQFVRQRSQIRKTLSKVYVDQTAIDDRLVEEIYRPSCDRGAAKVFASVFSSPQGKKVDDLLQAMSCPLLTIWGEGDPWMNSQTRSAKFREYYPSLTEHYLPAGHCPHDESPEQVNALIHNWVHQTRTG
jgi:pimeloyl-ACP methyl ester carboxylesterase